MRDYLLALCLIFFSLAVSAHADEPNIDSLINEGKAAFASKDFVTAYQAFNQAFLADPTNLDISFALGRSAFENGDYEVALMAFDRILIMSPNALRAKLEIARCHMRLGAYQIAKQYFYEVLSESPPESVKKNIDIYLAAIAATEKRNFLGGMFTVDLGFDDNARTSPNADKLGVFTPEPAVDEEIINTTLTATHIYSFEDSKISWKTTALSYNSFYTTYKDLDLILLGIATGPSYQTEKYLLDIQGIYNDLQLGYDQYMRQTGGAASITFPLAPAFFVSASTGLSKKNFAQIDDYAKDATNFTLSLSPTLIVGDNRISFLLEKERENADANYNSYDRLKWSLRFDRVLPHNFSFYSSITIKNTNYDAVKPLESLRSDTQTDLSIGIAKKLWQSEDKSKNISLQAKHTYTEAESSVATYAYRKNVTSTALSYIF
jgi:tetratricopeptide (TPR) repeat protein